VVVLGLGNKDIFKGLGSWLWLLGGLGHSAACALTAIPLLIERLASSLTTTPWSNALKAPWTVVAAVGRGVESG
jgi:hypothetical protein